jgi:N-acetylglucosaminylphosphatidylinositol deacetylase
MTLHYTIAISVLGFLTFWFLMSAIFASSYLPPAELRNKNIVLLIGHPDDEAMFFGPSLTALASPQNGNKVKIVCLSNGNAIGEGEIREGELYNSARRFGISKQDVYVKDEPRFQDGGQNDWKPEDISDFLSEHFAAQATPQSTSWASSSSTLEQRTKSRQHRQDQNGKPLSTSSTSSSPIPDVIVTFDLHGISTHPNHCACYHGAIHYLRRHPKEKSSPMTLYTLTTTSLLRKYISVLDAPITFLLQSITRGTTRPADSVVFISGFPDYARAFGAMVFAHKTQMLWFRWGWIIAGRYMVVNDLKRERFMS